MPGAPPESAPPGTAAEATASGRSAEAKGCARHHGITVGITVGITDLWLHDVRLISVIMSITFTVYIIGNVVALLTMTTLQSVIAVYRFKRV